MDIKVINDVVRIETTIDDMPREYVFEVCEIAFIQSEVLKPYSSNGYTDGESIGDITIVLRSASTTIQLGFYHPTTPADMKAAVDKLFNAWIKYNTWPKAKDDPQLLTE